MTTDMQVTVSGWVVAITGANRGIGRALVDAFSAAGATVIAHARTEAAARAVADALPGPAVAVSGDLRDPDLAGRLAAAAAERGGLDALILNAGVLGPMQPLAETDFTAFREAMEVNVDAQLRLFVEALPALRTRRGRVVWLTSYLGHAGLPGYGVYGASKHAVEGLMRLAHAEHADDGIISVAVSPGMVQTDMLQAVLGGGDISMHTPAAVAGERFAALVARLAPEHGGTVIDLGAD